VQVVNGATLFGVVTIGFALLFDRDRVHHAGHDAPRRGAGFGDALFELVFGERREGARLMGESLVDALRGERWA
jgi:hypothetical protein